jgi:Baseplate J-like protein
MSDVPSRNDLFQVARNEILTLNPQLTITAVERPGSDSNVLLAGAVAAGDEVVGQITRLAAGLFLDSATGAALDRLVFDRYGLVRKPAAAAIGSINFSLPTAPASSFTIPAGTVVSSANGTQYLTTSAVVFPATSNGIAPNPLITAPIRSVVAGAAQQAGVGTIVNMVSTIQLPAGVTGPLSCNNSLATAGAADAESDNSLRSRARNFFQTAQKGTLSAIQQGALAVPGVQTATAVEITDSSGNPARFVDLIIADQFTQLLINYSPQGALLPINYQPQSQVLAQNVANALLGVRAGGIFVDVIVANVQLISIAMALAFPSTNANTDQSAFLARAGVVAYVNGLSPGQNFDPTACAKAVFPTVPGLDSINSAIVSPAGLLEVTSITQVFRTTLALVTSGISGGPPVS